MIHMHLTRCIPERQTLMFNFNFGFLRFEFKTVYCIFVYNQVPDSCSKQGFTFMSDLEMTIYLISWFLRGDMLNVDKRQTEWREVKGDLNPHISQPSCCILNIFKVTHFESKFKFVFEPPPPETKHTHLKYLVALVTIWRACFFRYVS